MMRAIEPRTFHAAKQHDLLQRLGTSWRARFSPRSRYEIASAIAILGLILVLVTFAGIYMLYSTTGLTASFLYACTQMSISPVALVILTLCIGAFCLFFGIYLLPHSPHDPFHLFPS